MPYTLDRIGAVYTAGRPPAKVPKYSRALRLKSDSRAQKDTQGLEKEHRSNNRMSWYDPSELRQLNHDITPNFQRLGDHTDNTANVSKSPNGRTNLISILRCTCKTICYTFRVPPQIKKKVVALD